MAIVALLIVLSKLFAKFVTGRLKSNSIVDDEYTAKISWLVWEIIFYTLLVLSILIWFTILWVDFWWIMWWISFWIWFAFKEILGNLLSWILVLTNKEFKLWDVIVIDDDHNEYFGRIEEITIRYTVVRWFDLRKIIIPNLSLVTKPVRTYDSEEIVRLDLSFTIHYNSDLSHASEVIKQAVNSVSFVQEKDSTRVLSVNFWENGVEMLVYFYMDPKWWLLINSAKSQVYQAIIQALRNEKITIPYPHTTITVDYNDKNLLWSMIYVAKESKKQSENIW